MADIAFHHGTRVFESQEVPILIRTAQSAVVALIGTAPDADADLFPLNRPVLIKGSTELSKAAALGAAGTLKKAVDGVFDQIATYCYVVRVAEGISTNATYSNLVGDATAMTGVHALKKCEGLYGRKLKPRLVCVPGYTSNRATDGIATLNVTAAGGDYTTPPTVSFSGGGGSGAKATAIITDGDVTGFVVTKPGFGYTSAPTVTLSGGGGTGATATATVGLVTNPVVAELVGVLESLRAVSFVDGPDTTDANAVIYRETINSDRIYICDPKVLVWDTVLDAYVPLPASPRFAGVQAKVDRVSGFWWSVSNKPINGIGGTVRPISYGDQANYLNENHVNSIINLNGEGFVTWGNRVATGIDLNKFLSVRRTMDFINEAIEAANLEFVDKPFSKANIKFLIESNNAFMRVLKAEGAILGGRVWLDPERNTDTEMAQGRITFGVEFEPPAPMEDIRFIAHRQIRYYAVLRKEILEEVNDGAFALAA